MAQTCPGAGDVPANTEEHVRLTRTAAAEVAGVVVFRERSLTGCELDLTGRLVFSEGDDCLAPLLDAAASNGFGIGVVPETDRGPRCGGRMIGGSVNG